MIYNDKKLTGIYKSINKFYNNHTLKLVFFFGCMIGAFIFIYTYGINIVNVTYDDWLLRGGDLIQHYYGWEFFRQSDWTFPLGMIDGLNYPNKVSIIYTDSIPLVALFFKILSPILPHTFQYFGLWGIFCFMLQGGLSALLIKRFTGSVFISLLSSFLFCFSPILFQRMYYHTALASHWIILIAFCIWSYRKYFKGLLKNIIVWSSLFAVSASIHLYFLPMLCIILLGYLFHDFLESKNFIRPILTFASSITSAFAVMFLFGAFYSNVGYKNSGLGVYSYNLNGLFNSQGDSSLIGKLSNATGEQSNEGYAYLGLGIIILLVLAIVFKLLRTLFMRLNRKSNKDIKTKNYWVYLIPILTCSFLLTLMAVSPKVTLGSKVLFNIPYPQKIIDVLDVFRATGRFIWPLIYGVTLFAIVLFIKNSRRSIAICLLLVCVLIQIVDLKNVTETKHNNYASIVEYNNGLKSEAWNQLKSKKHIVFFTNDFGAMYTFGDFATKNKMTISKFYLARSDQGEIDKNHKKFKTDLENGNPDANTIYVFATQEDIVFNDAIYIYSIDNYIIGISKPINQIEDYPDIKPILKS